MTAMDGCAGWNRKPARQGKPSAHPTAVRESGEEAAAGAAMGLLKRKRTTPPESPASSKMRTVEEADFPISFSNEPAEGTQKKIQVGTCFALPPDGRVNQLSEQSNQSTMSELASEELARQKFEKDVDLLRNRIPSVVENVSYGQETLSRAGSPPEKSGPEVALPRELEAQLSAPPHLVPSHAGWFRWARIHQLERVALPEFFSAKEDSKKTPATYMEHRSCIMTKYRENPQKLIKFEDVRGLLTGDVSGSVRLFGFLDHWGLINYQAIAEIAPFSSSRDFVGSVEEKTNGALSVTPLVKPALANLFNFEAAQAPAHKLLSICPSPASDLPISSLAESAVQESLAAPAVEYHCNSCHADCSKRRYHCQKQADFDLCPDCYSDGKFGQGMTSTDFLRMDALTENADVNGGGWSDQETLLLLEALELYGDNWNEIAEHVATKSKAQCILHFIRLPIEDSFLEDMEAANSVWRVQRSATVVNQSASRLYETDVLAKVAQNDNYSSSEPTEIFPSTADQDSSVPTELSKKDVPNQNWMEECEPSSTSAEGKKESDVSNVIRKVNDSGDVRSLRAVSESTGCVGPGGLIAFVDAGNPVMSQVAFLAAMVGPRVAASAAQAALKSLADGDPVGLLSEKNCFGLDGSDICDSTLATGFHERGHQSIEIRVVSSIGGATVSSDGKPTSKAKEEARKKGIDENVPAGMVRKTAGEGALTSGKSQTKASTNARVVEQDVPSVAKVRTAAANALASAAVKAKLLADQEEREIQRLVAGVIENQLKKLELKLKHFSELELMLGKECEQAEKARAKVYTERARIVASRLSSPSSATGCLAASHSKISSQVVTSVAQPRPAVFTFGPTGLSAPAAVCLTTAGLSSSSLPAGTFSQQGVSPRKIS